MLFLKVAARLYGNASRHTKYRICQGNPNGFRASVNKQNLIFFDDQMIEAGKDDRIVKLFTKGSHHRNLSVIYIVQNLFHQGKGNRSISLNSHYLVLFKNPSDKLQVLTLAKQMYPGHTDFFLKQYQEAVRRLSFDRFENYHWR